MQRGIGDFLLCLSDQNLSLFRFSLSLSLFLSFSLSLFLSFSLSLVFSFFFISFSVVPRRYGVLHSGVVCGHHHVFCTVRLISRVDDFSFVSTCPEFQLRKRHF